MTSAHSEDRANDSRVCLSIGIIAWNEEEAIEATLRSVWRQTLFSEIHQRGLRSEIIVLANGCTDRTVELTNRFFTSVQAEAIARSVSCRVIEVVQRGKNHSWNLFVHSYSALHAACLYLMDADIAIQGRDSLWSMYCALEADGKASVSVDQPLKDIALNPRKSVSERISVATSGMTQAIPGQLSGQLYCIRSSIARQIYLPRDLSACEDGFIKALVCTDFLTSPVAAERIVTAPGAAHVFESYRKISEVMRNQKRQMIGQTIVHILVDKYLNELSLSERVNMADAIRQRENSDRDWLKRLIAEHLREIRYFWRLFPNLLRFRFERWRVLPALHRIRCLPSLLVGYGVTLLASHMAYRFLKQGSIDYWPHTRSPGLKQFVPNGRSNTTSEPLITPAIQP